MTDLMTQTKQKLSAALGNTAAADAGEIILMHNAACRLEAWRDEIEQLRAERDQARRELERAHDMIREAGQRGETVRVGELPLLWEQSND